MPKNIVVFSDGTGQDGGSRPEQTLSNVYKMYRACHIGPGSAIDPHEQVSFYDAGLGTDIGATALTSPMRFIQKMLASVTGRGISTNIADCYEFIINHSEPGDRIFLIGFSRGAYTVRCLANVLMLCGVPTAVGADHLPRFRKATRDIAEEAVSKVFEHGAGHPRAKYEQERFEQARRFRVKYGSNNPEDEGESNAAPHFVGVFDTVAALGATGLRQYLIGFGLVAAAALVVAAVAGALMLFTRMAFWKLFLLVAIPSAAIGAYKAIRPTLKVIRNFPERGNLRWHFAVWKANNYDKLLSGYVGYARSANAIDEKRADFNRVAWGSAGGVRARVGDEPAPLLQLWFAGNHSDVGGSYPEVQSRLSDIALQWMIEQATSIPNGLKIGPVFVNGEKMPGTADVGDPLRVFPSADGVQHCEIAGMRDTIDQHSPGFLRWLTAHLNWKEKIRTIKPDAPVHESVGRRFELSDVRQCAGFGAYRPPNLSEHNKFRKYYASEAEPSDTSAAVVERANVDTA